ncbi:MAG: M20/M25/M40 family metallo-hydrolase, partial [Pseudomonadota bacterium]|nr:M20/M25/M40 family metallo-hydrolase [Pseudomonadota bacterium]
MKFGDWRAAALVVVLVLGAWMAWLAAGTPRPLGADASPGVFSAGRAMVDDSAMAAKPHPIGSAEAGLVRSYLIQRMQAMGLEPRTAPGIAVETPRWIKGVVVGARVENLVGVLKGTDPSLPAVMLMAHSDSVPGSPGAADDAAGVVSAFEVIRALQAAGPHKRDVAVLITDGEEAGLLGARAFFASGDPLLKHVGEVVNLEARGGGGRVNMFQMGDRDGGHMKLFTKAVGDTNANSLTSEVYKYMPNDTDFTVSRAA